MQPFGSSQPDRYDCNGVKRHHFSVQGVRIQGIIVKAGRRFLAATVGRWHLHLTALVLHLVAAGKFRGAHLRMRNDAGRRWDQAQHQQQYQDTKLAKNAHVHV
jgi:hypothetical protein